jgi:uncharacterized protein YcbX
MANITNIYRYPVKGLSPEELARIYLRGGEAMPGDRRHALARTDVIVDAEAPCWLPKRNFLMLALNGRLAALKTRFNDTSNELELVRDGNIVARGKLSDAAGREAIENYIAAYLGPEAGGRPHIITGTPPHTFSDVDARVISLINLATVGDMQRAAGRRVEPLRFRANVYFNGELPWAEFDWVGREISLGKARLRVNKRTSRCAATAVNPSTGERDLNVVKILKTDHGHIDMGVYATVIEGGDIAIGDTIAVQSD